MTLYCYDTEFLEDGHTIELISIGIVCEDGREYYAVNSDMDHKRITNSDWLVKNVVPHLPLNGEVSPGGFGDKPSWALDMRSTLVKPKWVIANEVREFLMAVDPPQLWAYYAAYDHVALAQLWGRMINLPKGLPMYTHDLKQEMDRLGIDSDAVPRAGDEHDALADARWNWAMLREIRNAVR